MSRTDRIDVEAARGDLQDGSHPEKLGVPKESKEDILEEIEELAERGMSFVLMPVWMRIKPEDMPTYPSWRESLYDMFIKSWYNVPFVVVPLAFAWASHFNSDTWGNKATFVLCFIAMIPLQKIFDWGGDELGLFLGNEPRDLLIITLSNAIEAALAVILLFKCQLRLLQSTVIGVVLLHLLLIPGVAFFIQGAQIYEQRLHQFSSLNHSLLMIGVLGVLVPTVFFAALDRGSVVSGSGDQSGLPPAFVPLVSDAVRRDILQMSRGIAVMLLVIYLAGCLYRHNVLPIPGHPDPPSPTIRTNTLGANPGMTNAHPAPGAPTSPCSPNAGVSPSRTVRSTTSGNTFHSRSATNQSSHSTDSITPRDGKERKAIKSEVNPWVCAVLLIAAVAFMGVTAEFLVKSIEILLDETDNIQTEWVGLVLLPIVSFSADGAVVIWNFSVALCRYTARRLRVRRAQRDTTSASPGAPQMQPFADPRVLVDTPHEGYVEEPREIDTPRRPTNPASSPPSFTMGVDIPDTNVRHRRRINVSRADEEPEGEDQPAQTLGKDRVEDVLELPWVSEFAHGRPIDLSIQFTLWWTPLLVLLGWWTERPMHLLFDYFEVGMLLGACFLVNYVTVDEKTNMSEGLTMISFYAMIATAAWFYPGQPQVAFMLSCPGTVAEAVAQGAEGTGANLIKISGQ